MDIDAILNDALGDTGGFDFGDSSGSESLHEEKKSPPLEPDEEPNRGPPPKEAPAASKGKSLEFDDDDELFGALGLADKAKEPVKAEVAASAANKRQNIKKPSALDMLSQGDDDFLSSGRAGTQKSEGGTGLSPGFNPVSLPRGSSRSVRFEDTSPQVEKAIKDDWLGIGESKSQSKTESPRGGGSNDWLGLDSEDKKGSGDWLDFLEEPVAKPKPKPIPRKEEPQIATPVKSRHEKRIEDISSTAPPMRRQSAVNVSPGFERTAPAAAERLPWESEPALPPKGRRAEPELPPPRNDVVSETQDLTDVVKALTGLVKPAVDKEESSVKKVEDQRKILELEFLVSKLEAENSQLAMRLEKTNEAHESEKQYIQEMSDSRLSMSEQTWRRETERQASEIKLISSQLQDRILKAQTDNERLIAESQSRIESVRSEKDGEISRLRSRYETRIRELEEDFECALQRSKVVRRSDPGLEGLDGIERTILGIERTVQSLAKETQVSNQLMRGREREGGQIEERLQREVERGESERRVFGELLGRIEAQVRQQVVSQEAERDRLKAEHIRLDAMMQSLEREKVRLTDEIARERAALQASRDRMYEDQKVATTELINVKQEAAIVKAELEAIKASESGRYEKANALRHEQAQINVEKSRLAEEKGNLRLAQEQLKARSTELDRLTALAKDMEGDSEAAALDLARREKKLEDWSLHIQGEARRLDQLRAASHVLCSDCGAPVKDSGFTVLPQSMAPAAGRLDSAAPRVEAGDLNRRAKDDEEYLRGEAAFLKVITSARSLQYKTF